MKSVRRLSGLSFLVVTLLAAGLSPGVASAQDFQGQRTAPFETRWAMPTLPAVNYSLRPEGVAAKTTPPDPCSRREPPDPCSFWAWAKSVLGTVEALF